MKKLIRICSVALAAILLSPNAVHANMGDMGFFGGITEGRKLPKTTELLLKENNTKNASKKKNTQVDLSYKETLFLTGRPEEFEGLLRIKSSGAIEDTKDNGTYTVSYTVGPSATTSVDNQVVRALTFTVNWRREKSQIIKDYSVKSWTETVTVGGVGFTLDPAQSYYDISVIEDHTAGVVYYRGDISQRAVYTEGGGGGNDVTATTVEASGSTYGYDCAWSNTETQRIDVTVSTDDWSMQYQVRPSVSMSKELQYTQNEPTAISFSGNYKEVMQNESGAAYDIFVLPQQFYDTETTGKMTIDSNNTFEQLIAPDLDYVKGHFAEYDIRKLFAMKILDGDSQFYQPDQAITRGQFVSALVRAIKLPVDPVEASTKTKKTQTIKLTFPDVLPTNVNYPYIMAAYKYGIAIGRGNGYFYSDASMEREEMIAVLVHSVGLENLGLNPTPMTRFTDDAQVSDWAKRDLYAAERMGLISPDEDGNIRPKDFVTKAEAAAMLNRLVEYLRSDLKTDYAEHIVNYSK